LHEEFFVDGFGQRTLLECVPFASEFNLNRLTLPVPDDGFHAEALEYIALIDSIQRAGKSFCAVELGAGWAPWISLAGVLARKKGLSQISLVGVEASLSRFELMRKQLAFNSLRPDSKDNDTFLDNIYCKLFEDAAGIEPGWLYFPDVPVSDMGSATSTENCQLDYRGILTKNLKVKTYTLREIFGDYKNVDYLHMDIQGSEYDLIASNLALLKERVEGMMIATHSRIIEGKLIELLWGSGWYLHREKPCIVDWHSSAPTITGMTKVDGCQYWRRI
jgi:FkbM family methyltransferase